MTNWINNLSDDSEKTDIFCTLSGLIFCCPLDQSNPGSCPLHAVRLKPKRERFEWAHRLTEQEACSLYEKHQVCSQKRPGPPALSTNQPSSL